MTILSEPQNEARDRRKIFKVIPALHTLHCWTPLSPQYPKHTQRLVLDCKQRGLGVIWEDHSLYSLKVQSCIEIRVETQDIFYPLGQTETSPAVAYAMP